MDQTVSTKSIPLPALVERHGVGPSAAFSITQEGLEVVEAMAARGNSQKAIAAFLGMSTSVLQKLARDEAAVGLAWQRGKQQLEDELVGMLLAKARKGDTACIIYATKALLGFTDQARPQDDRPPAITINLPSSLSEADYRRMLNVTPAEVVADA